MSYETRLFVGNLPENTNEKELNKAFTSYGQLTNCDIKSKPGEGNESKKFAFITLSATNYDIESCIKYFSNNDFNGSRLYVTKARESFLERLQRERAQAQEKEANKNAPKELPKKNPVIKLSDKLNPRKRKSLPVTNGVDHSLKEFERKQHPIPIPSNNVITKEAAPEKDKKQQDADKKRLESMKKKRQEFKQKQNIIKTGLIGIDKVQNKKLIFSDNDDEAPYHSVKDVHKKPITKDKNVLFDDDDSGDEVNFEIKQQFEGAKGQKVLDLQSRYKSDKRFVLDERFIEEDQEAEEAAQAPEDEGIDVGQVDEKAKQLDILQNVLGVAIKSKSTEPPRDGKKIKAKLGMLRFDPSQPEHEKFLVPKTEAPQVDSKKSKKKRKGEDLVEPAPIPEGPKVEVSKEQFYEVSDTLKEALAQPNTFSLRSLFGQNTQETEEISQDSGYIPLEKPKAPKVKNPLEPKEKNPFAYDSSDSESEEPEAKKVKIDEKQESQPDKTEVKAVWKENLFFTVGDSRLKEGLSFFNRTNENNGHKERRELKSLMKKRIYNKDKKNQMFQKKIGGKRKTMKKSFRRKS